MIYRIALSLSVTLLALAGPALAQAPRTSSPGRYEGFSREIYDGWQRSSIYVPARDGTRLAIDIFRPVHGRKVEKRRLPVLLSITQYRRAVKKPDGTIQPAAADMLDLVKHGYVIVVADARGKGASLGIRRGPWSDAEARDAADLIQWSAAQPWSTGKVGMFGVSYLAGIQLAAAREKPPALKAIMPMGVPFEIFDSFMGMVPPAGPLSGGFEEATDLATAPVDADSNGAMLRQAIEEHRRQTGPGAMPNRDSLSSTLGINYYDEVNPSAHLREISDSKVAIYTIGLWGNWLVTGSTSGFANFANPKKLLLFGGQISGATTSGQTAIRYQVEHLRWFDYWLKGIDNGVMTEPAVTYTVANTGELRTSARWPALAKLEPLYLGKGTLTATAQQGAVAFPVAYDVTRADRAAKGAQFTSAPFAAARLLLGHAQAEFLAATSATDGDFIAYLQDVAPDGKVSDITEGRIRASGRAEFVAPFDTLGQPWHRGNTADLLPMTPGRAERMRFSFLPIAWQVEAGHRLRLIVTGSMLQQAGGMDLFNTTPRQTPPPTQTLVLDGSRLILPFAVD